MIKHTIAQHLGPHKPELRLAWLVIGIVGISAIGWLINSYTPNGYAITGFFFVLFVTAATLAFFITNNKRRAFLLSGAVVAFFLLRILKLREPIYLLLLVASLLSLEVYLKKR